MSIINNIENCRLCHSENIEDVISLGEQYITSRFPKYGDFSTPKTSIDLCHCEDCGLLQLKQTTFSSELYEYEYGYRSGISNTMRQHFKDYYEEILSKVTINDGDTIVDIGSNDSTLLQQYSSTLKRIGIDPTGKQFRQYYGDIELIPNYFTVNNYKNVYGERKCKVVTSISMFYDLPDPVQFAKDIYEILEEDGIWSCEQSYMPSMINTNSIDTICHEHLEYYALMQVKNIADRAQFKIIDVKFNDCNGGSFRVYFAKRGSSVHFENKKLVDDIINNEIEMGVMSRDIFKTFMTNCDKEVQYLRDFIETIQKNGKKMYVYGASTKGNCLLQYANLGETQMKYAVERNPNKVGKMTCTGIEIISEETMRDSPPDFMLVLPWHFRKEILERESDFLNNGGQFVFPFPHFEIVSKKPIALITGCDGFIAHYVKTQFTDHYILYGIGSPKSEPDLEQNIINTFFDMNNSKKLEDTICMIKPDVIIHLAGISSSQYAFNNPLETIETNGMITVNICDIIHKNGLKTKLFNASSSQIYTGNVNYTVQENDNNKYHIHPYSIAKIMAHNMVDFYRSTYNLPFSNGVLFTTESKLKKPIFLLNKVTEHIKKWLDGNKTPLIVGNLDSYRNIIHASDVASAIMTIVLQEKGDNYLICHNESNKTIVLVMRLYVYANIEVEQRDNIVYEKSTQLPLLIQQTEYGCEQMPVNIRGYQTKLTSLGWSPKMSVNNILEELL